MSAWPARYAWLHRCLFGFVDDRPTSLKDPSGLTCGDGWRDGIVPDNPMGCPFSQFCQVHDDCYDTCGVAKSFCDLLFQQCLIRAGNDGAGCCLPLAAAYFVAVDEHGQDAYEEAQYLACNTPIFADPPMEIPPDILPPIVIPPLDTFEPKLPPSPFDPWEPQPDFPTWPQPRKRGKPWP